MVELERKVLTEVQSESMTGQSGMEDLVDRDGGEKLCGRRDHGILLLIGRDPEVEEEDNDAVL